MIHVYELNDYKVAIDGNSGSVHLLDTLTYDILKGMDRMLDFKDVLKLFGERYEIEALKEAYEEIKSLYDGQMLFTENTELKVLAFGRRKNNSVKALCLHVAHDCNLKCQYCFASEGDYKSGRQLMPLEIAKKSVDYLLTHSEGRKKIEIDFFGGEPLLNFDVVKETVFYAKSLEALHQKQFYFTLTTNGVLLDDEKNAFLNAYMDNVVISIDGRKEVHNYLRPDCGGKGSYDRIVPQTQALIAERGSKSYYVRGTFTTHNKDFGNDVMHLADLGFKEISVEPVVGSGNPLHFTAFDLETLIEAYEDLAIQYTQRLSDGRGFNFYHFNVNVFDGPCLSKRITACGAGGEYLAVSPDGVLYPCHQFVGEPSFEIGTIETGIHNTKVANGFVENTILTKPACMDCWAKLFCSGGCHANAYYSNQNIQMPNQLSCELQKKRIECAIMVQAFKEEYLMR